MLTIKKIITAWDKVYGEDMIIEYPGFISELKKIIAKEKSDEEIEEEARLKDIDDELSWNK
tara:strand:+ start:54 stop:236 length:183 start_codon:yes stop_codon:yes gene_type:complete